MRLESCVTFLERNKIPWLAEPSMSHHSPTGEGGSLVAMFLVRLRNSHYVRIVYGVTAFDLRYATIEGWWR